MFLACPPIFLRAPPAEGGALEALVAGPAMARAARVADGTPRIKFSAICSETTQASGLPGFLSEDFAAM